MSRLLLYWVVILIIKRKIGIFMPKTRTFNMMSKRLSFILLAGLLCFASIHAQAQDKSAPKPPHKVTQTSTDGARFEILIMYNEDTPTFFRFDKFTGDLWELSNGFRPLKLFPYTREPHVNDEAEGGKINYQIIAWSTSTFYLINLNTGVMWEKTPDDLFKRKTALQVVREE